MKATSILRCLLRELAGVRSQALDCDFYIFGSILTKCNCISDVDILVVYRDLEKLALVKKAFSLIKAHFPLEIVFMTTNEEQEFRFIETQGAQPLEDFLAARQEMRVEPAAIV